MSTRWQEFALDYIPSWMEFQLRQAEQPGCVIAISSKGKLVFEQAFGFANAGAKTKLTPRHRFRVASHSKSFTAAGVLRLRELGALRLDDPVGNVLSDLHPAVAKATFTQLLSHSAGLIRDGRDCGQWLDRRPFLSRDELLADLSDGPTIDASERLKYSNHGYGLVGLAMESIVGESFSEWIQREVVEAAGLKETIPDAPESFPRSLPFASGHTQKLPEGRRLIIPGKNPTNALAPATGFISTARDLVRFYTQLCPSTRGSFLSASSRREMVRRQWTDSYSSFPRDYGLGIISGKSGPWSWLGHSGGFQGFITRTATIPDHSLTLSVLTNSANGMAHQWLEGVMNILQTFHKYGPPSRRLAPWKGRWCSLWGTVDLVAAGDRVLAGNPALSNPFQDVTEIEVTRKNVGTIVADSAFGDFGEDVELVRTPKGTVTHVHFAGAEMKKEAVHLRELRKRYRKR